MQSQHQTWLSTWAAFPLEFQCLAGMRPRLARRRVFDAAPACLMLLVVWFSTVCSSNGQEADAIGEEWIRNVVEYSTGRCDLTHSGVLEVSPSGYEPKPWTEKQKFDFAMRGIKKEKTPRRQMACLKILAERFPISLCKELEKISGNGSLSIEIRTTAIRIAGFRQDPANIPWLKSLTLNMEPGIREAALDALGLIVFPRYLEKMIQSGFNRQNGTWIEASLPVYIENIVRIRHSKIDLTEKPDLQALKILKATSFLPNSAPQFPEIKKTREELANLFIDRMTTSRTPEERIAAARALAGYSPTGYSLRMAEWGVWIQSGNKLDLAQTVIDEIPPFAFRTEKTIAELNQRVNQIMVVTKPIIHLTSDRPLSVDVTAYIRAGQPWFSYPRPNDFKIMVEASNSQISDSDFQQIKLISTEGTKHVKFGKESHDGYPWLFPRSSKKGGISGFRRRMQVSRIASIGVAWQHLIVTPAKAAWMLEKGVQKKYDWWSGLRQVQSSWISNGRDSEKFLYYDGPTKLPSPLKLTQDKQGNWKFEYFLVQNKTVGSTTNPVLTEPAGLLIKHSQGRLTGRFLAFQKVTNSNPVKQNVTPFASVSGIRDSDFDLDAKAISSQLKKIVMKGDGLTSSEADGFIQAWEQQMLKTPGLRLLVRMPRRDYDYRCPIEVFPAPTSTARVGLIYAELTDRKTEK